MITEKNWTHSIYKCADKKAMITFGADESASFLYFVSILDQENREVHQTEYSCLIKASQHINTEYGHWQFEDLDSKKDDGGCSSCAAH